MNYSVKELRENLTEKIANLGISKGFRNNPALASAIAQIDVAIGQMNMAAHEQTVHVTEEQGIISFNWTSPEDNRSYSISIECHEPETFKCTVIQEEAPFTINNGQLIKQKSVVEHVATIDEQSGFITLTTNGALIDNIDCSVQEHNTRSWAETRYYTPQGVMRDREYKSYASTQLQGSFEATGTNDLVIPRQAFSTGSPFYNGYEVREFLTREKFDTARLIVDDKKRDIRYNSTVLLKQEHGLRDMEVQGGYDPYPKEVTINPLTPEEIEEKLKRENPIVAEGLREYAKDRDIYYYDSTTDQNFIAAETTSNKSI